MPASNAQQEIVHKGSGHRAVGFEGCLNGPHENVAPAANLAAGASTKTTIEGNPIALVGRTQWDPSTGGGILGTKSGTTLKEAVVVSGSKDVVIEGAPVARAGDPTTQNHGNASGAVTPASLAVAATSVEVRAKKNCKLTKWEASSIDAGRLGYPGKDKTGAPNYLEVKQGDTVTFVATRHDITQTPNELNPSCELGPHTNWLAKGKVFPLFIDTKEKKQVGIDTFAVPGDLVVEPFAMADIMAEVGTKDPVAVINSLARLQLEAEAPTAVKTAAGTLKVDVRTFLFFCWWWCSAPDINVTATSCAGPLDAVLKVFPKRVLSFSVEWDNPLHEESFHGKKYDEVTKKLEDKKKATEGAQNQAAADQAKYSKLGDANVGKGLLESDKADSLKGTDGASKTGNERATNRGDNAFDKAKDQFKKAEEAKAKFDKAAKTIDSLKDALKTLDKSLSTVEKLSDLANVPLQFDLCKGLNLTVTMSYERTKDRESARGWGYYTAARVGQKWKVDFGCPKLIGLRWSPTVSLLLIAGPYMATVAQLLRKYNIVNVDLGFLVDFAIAATIFIEKDQHDEFAGGDLLSSKFAISMFIELGGASVDVVKATVSLSASLSIEFRPPTGKGALIKMTPRAGVSATRYSVVLFPDHWWKLTVASGTIPALEYSWNEDGSFFWEQPNVPH